eukprot:TRINITY_DN3371_c1_g1_i1.p1 TRINITY_DN3371_c1_g1~~TRINITY_DN3371_c1_g1_i1.p1  ORF type:complete len:101 (+),score=16.89 TRINITY_DN3371_c1_g1_i1:189-491(+)
MATTTTTTTTTPTSMATEFSQESLSQLSRELRVPDYFPHVRKPCREPAARFFHCFSEESRVLNDQDDGAGYRGLLKCQAHMKSYQQCMDPIIKKEKEASS